MQKPTRRQRRQTPSEQTSMCPDTDPVCRYDVGALRESREVVVLFEIKIEEWCFFRTRKGLVGGKSSGVSRADEKHSLHTRNACGPMGSCGTAASPSGLVNKRTNACMSHYTCSVTALRGPVLFPTFKTGASLHFSLLQSTSRAAPPVNPTLHLGLGRFVPVEPTGAPVSRPHVYSQTFRRGAFSNSCAGCVGFYGFPGYFVFPIAKWALRGPRVTIPCSCADWPSVAEGEMLGLLAVLTCSSAYPQQQPLTESDTALYTIGCDDQRQTEAPHSEVAGGRWAQFLGDNPSPSQLASRRSNDPPHSS